MVEKIKKYANYIIIGLLGLLLFQSCRSCVSSNTYMWDIKQKQETIDSLGVVIKKQSQECDSLKGIIMKYQGKIESQESMIDALDRDKQYLKEQNSTLNGNLKKSLDKK